MSQSTTILLLAADDPRHEGIVEPGTYVRMLEPNGFVYRLPNEATAHQVRHQARLLGHKGLSQFHTEVVLDNAAVPDDLAIAFSAGLYLSQYQSGAHKSDREQHPMTEGVGVIRFTKDSPDLTVAYQRQRMLAATQLQIMALVDAPANVKRPQYLAEWAVNSGEKYGYNVEVLGKEQCQERGLGALLAVNRGSEDPARFIIMEHRGESGADAGWPSSSPAVVRDAGESREKSKVPTVAIIGKGITFDTGGISIKGSANLHLMKSDMGGAAAVLGTLEAAAKTRLPIHLIGIIPCTDNSVDALSIKPSDVITGHSGKTIEIIDTDAEGRLVMSDGLSYALQHYRPDYLLDIATLTGSTVRTFGYECAAVMSKNEALVEALRKAGDSSGERVWPLPPWDAYRSGLDSDVADIKNFSGKPINGAIDAFKFLEFFTDEHPAFAHLDIAGVALKQGPFAGDRQATGYGMRLLLTWLEGLV